MILESEKSKPGGTPGVTETLPSEQCCCQEMVLRPRRPFLSKTPSKGDSSTSLERSLHLQNDGIIRNLSLLFCFYLYLHDVLASFFPASVSAFASSCLRPSLWAVVEHLYFPGGLPLEMCRNPLSTLYVSLCPLSVFSKSQLCDTNKSHGVSTSPLPVKSQQLLERP